jgi:hypothetical protein
MEREAITQREISRLKKRRDELLNTACNRFEREEIFKEVTRINEMLRTLHVRLGSAEPEMGLPGR